MTWQQIIDAVYGFWQESDVNYFQVLEYAREEYGELAELSILVKNYNYQVENGGHLQYFENGYCDGNGGVFGRRDEDVPLHHRMLDLMQQFNLHTTEIGAPVYAIMQAFADKLEVVAEYEEEYEIESDCPDCDGTGYTDEEESELCGNCAGGGTVCETEYEFFEEQIYIPDNLDDDYYAINAEFVNFFEHFITENL